MVVIAINQIAIIRKNTYIPLCPYCNQIAVRKSNTKNHFHNYIYVCENCGASVAAHSCDLAPMGFPADKEIRMLRYTTHKVFEDYAKSHNLSKSELYRKLATKFGIQIHKCHIGMFSYDELKKVYKYLKKQIKKY